MGILWSTQPAENQSDSSEEEYDDFSDMDSKTEDMAADAAKTTVPITENKVQSPSIQSINEDQVREIEKFLETFEKISLTYLLYEDPHVALQHVQTLLMDKNFNNLRDWIKAEESLGNAWQQKFIEALTIVQNYEVLRKLGFLKKDMYERFLPLTKTKSLFVNPLKKCLYRMCEDFTREDTKKFLTYAERDLKVLPNYNDDEKYLEVYLLYFETEKYIDCRDVNNSDVKNVIKICKYMELDNLKNELEIFSPKKPKQAIEEMTIPRAPSYDSSTDSSDEHDLEEFNIDKTPSLVSKNKTSGKKGKAKKSHLNIQNVVSSKLGDKYYIDPMNPGILIIINNEHFYSECQKDLIKLLPSSQQLEQRHGTEEDKKTLKDTFEQFGFKVVCFDNLSHDKILSEIMREVQKIDKESSIFVAILSHGAEGAVYGSNSIPLKVSEIQNMMCNRSLAGKPKVLILQCCQGTEIQDLMKSDDLSTDGPSNALQDPKTADMLLFWATVPGYSAIRHKKSGTWFIQAFCMIMKKKSTYHFEDICVLIKKEVTEKRWHQKVMVPLVESTFSKFLYLPSLK